MVTSKMASTLTTWNSLTLLYFDAEGADADDANDEEAVADGASLVVGDETAIATALPLRSFACLFFYRR
jgi:hypothetical protein